MARSDICVMLLKCLNNPVAFDWGKRVSIFFFIFSYLNFFSQHKIQPNWELWPKLYYQHQQSYIRQKLLAIKYLWQGKSRPEVAKQVGCSYVTLTEWIDKFLKGGLLELTKQITHQVPSRLNEEQQMELKRMLLESTPTDYGIDRYFRVK